MKNDLLKKLLPHIIAIAIFLVVSVLFCKPVLEGNVLNQRDIVGWKGIAQSSFDYKAAHGHFPLWNSSLFAGMPNYMIVLEGKSVLPNFSKILSFGLPEPISQFFLAAICFYILCLAFRLHPVVSILGGLAYSFATYNPVIIHAGHMTKMYAIAYMPLLLAGIIFAFHRKYWLGLALTTLGACLQVSANHPQVSYYFFIIATFITIAYLVRWIQQKDWKHIGTALGIVIISGLLGVATSAVSLMSTREYSKATIRGGKNLSIQGDSVRIDRKEGLDTSYAFQYSMMKSEPLVVMMPKAFGSNSGEPLPENTHVIEKLVEKGIPENSAAQVAGSLSNYWGGLESTTGPPYIGAITCILALLGFVVIKHPVRWGLLAASILSILMSWGKFLPGFNTFLFETLPFYNKFRAPSMALIILQLTLPVTAVLAAQQLFFQPDSREQLKASFKKILYTLGGLGALLAIMYVAMDYSSPADAINSYYLQRMGADQEITRVTISGLKADRSVMFGGQVLRTFAYIVLVLGVIWAYMKNWLKPVVAGISLAVVAIADLLILDTKYLNEDNYTTPDSQDSRFVIKTPIDERILSDNTPHFRVYNEAPDRFSDADHHYSIFHKAIGGYHPAKLRIYQDVMERYLYGGVDNRQVLNMLNVRYVIQAQQAGQPLLLTNPDAYGPCWLVKHIKIVKDDVEAIQALGTTNLKDTAVVQQEFAAGIQQPQWDSAATISLVKYDNDEIEYSAECSTPQFAVFSEVYYPYGWNAYIDGKKTDHVRTNYTLRGLPVPAGKHSIKFVFEPATYKKANTIAYTSSFLVLLAVIGGIFMQWWKGRRK